jgi:nucleotidyltransferase/DNA polymerase involved in DNA repair
VGFLFERLWAMGRGVLESLQQEGFQTFRTVVITVRFADFETHTRSHTLPRPANSLRVLQFEAMKLFMPFLDRRENPHRKMIRLLGVRLEKLGR